MEPAHFVPELAWQQAGSGPLRMEGDQLQKGKGATCGAMWYRTQGAGGE